MFNRKKKTDTQSVTANQKMFRRSNVYPAEYILLTVAGFALIVSAMMLVHAIAGSLITPELANRNLGLISQYLTMFLIFAPAFYWLYTRVTGEEMVRPGVRAMGVRTVFLSLFIIASVLVFLFEAIRGLNELVKIAVGMPNVDVNDSLLNTVAAAVVIGFTTVVISILVKNSDRRFTMRSGVVLAAASVALILASIGGIINAKSHQNDQPTNPDCRHMTSSGVCTIRQMRGPRG